MEVAEQIRKGVELIVGARRDAAFGPIVMFGLGGVYVEVLGDVAFRSVPVARSEIEAMIKQTRAHRLLLGVRGEARRDERAAVDALLKLGAVVDACPEITDIEINPLVVFEEGRGARALDIRVMLGEGRDPTLPAPAFRRLTPPNPGPDSGVSSGPATMGARPARDRIESCGIPI